jgi:hypothetical protein
MRLARLAALAVGLALASCDGAEPASSELVGTWLQAYTEERLTVTSGADQTYRTYDVEAQDGILVGGRYSARLRYTTTPFPPGVAAPDTVVVEDRCPEAALCNVSASTRLEVSRGLLALSREGEAGFRYEVANEALTFTARGGVLTVPRIEVPTPAGFVEIGGALTVREIALAAGVPSALPPRRVAFRSHALTLEGDGTAVRLSASGATETGRWEASADTLRITFGGATTASVYAVDDAALVLVNVPPAPDVRAVERARGLAPGSVRVAALQTVVPYERFRP